MVGTMRRVPSAAAADAPAGTAALWAAGDSSCTVRSSPYSHHTSPASLPPAPPAPAPSRTTSLYRSGKSAASNSAVPAHRGNVASESSSAAAGSKPPSAACSPHTNTVWCASTRGTTAWKRTVTLPRLLPPQATAGARVSASRRNTTSVKLARWYSSASPADGFHSSRRSSAPFTPSTSTTRLSPASQCSTPSAWRITYLYSSFWPRGTATVDVHHPPPLHAMCAARCGAHAPSAPVEPATSTCSPYFVA
mmetsp:Transcript_10981/g.38229  ORF Transcript_10981/g.38229 Transcript_10981/m.38229 type:complete len:250 (+) Transcript_10981:1539-2288(+)